MSGSDVVTVHVPFRTVRRGGRKVIVVPNDALPAPIERAELAVDAVLLRAIVRAWRWRREIEDGRATTITEIAEQNGLTVSFVGRMLALTTLAPDLLQTALDGGQTPLLSLTRIAGNLPPLWQEQRSSAV